MRHGLLVAVGLVASPCGAGGQVEERSLPAEAVGEIETIVASALDSVPIPGLAAGVVIGDRLAYARGFGYADLDSRAPITPRRPVPDRLDLQVLHRDHRRPPRGARPVVLR